MAITRTGTVPAEGTEIAYLRIGEGAPLVILPGGPRFGFAHLRPALDVLADGRELIYVDERGSGSSPAGDPASISTAGTLSDLDGRRAGRSANLACRLGRRSSLCSTANSFIVTGRSDKLSPKRPDGNG